MINDIYNKLLSYYRKKIFISCFKNILLISIITILLLIFFISLENLFFFYQKIRFLLYILVSVVIGGSILLILYHLLKSFYKISKINYENVAYEIGNFYADIKDRLGNALQLLAKNPNNNLVKQNFQIVSQTFNKYDTNQLLSYKSISKFFYSFAGILFASIILFNTSFKYGFERILHYQNPSTKYLKYKIYVISADKIAKYGENYLVKFKIYDNISKSYITNTVKPVKIFIKKINQPDFLDYKISNIKNDTLSYIVKNPDIDFSFYIDYNNTRSSQYDVKIVYEPLVTKTIITVTPPSYTKISEYKEIDNGNISVPRGSKISYEIQSSEPLNNAFITTSNNKFQMNVIDNYKAATSFNVFNDITYSINLSSVYNFSNKPIEYKIKVMNDEYPLINVILPNQLINKITNNRLECMLDIADDYGLHKLTLNYKITVSKYSPPQNNFSSIEIPIDKNKNQQTVNYFWNFSNLSLVPGEEVAFYFEVFDNDAISGYKSVKTNIYKIAVPNLDEIFAENQTDVDKFQKKIETTIKEFNEVKEELSKIKKELKQDKQELTWQEKEKLQKTIEKYEKLAQKVQEIKKEFSELKNKSLENNLLSKETLEKYLELQELMKEFTSEEYRKALERMQKSLENMNRSQVQQDLQNMEFSEEMFRKSVERTLNLFKRIQIEQKFDEINKRLENLTNQLDNLNKNLDNAQNKDDILKQQKEIQKQIKELNQQLDNLQKKMKEFNDLPNNELSELLNNNNPENNESLMQSSMNAAQSGDMQNAKNMQNRVKNNLSNLQQGLSSLKQKMMQKNQQETFTKMLKIINNLIEISKQQENLRNTINNNKENYTQYSNYASQQQNILDNLLKTNNTMAELAQKSFLITPEVANLLGNSLNEIRNSINFLNNANSYSSVQSQTQIIKYLNELAKLLSNTLKNMAKGNGGGSGAMSLMQQFQQLIQQQMQINNLTQQLANGQQLTQEQLQLARRLQQQQEIIRKSLEQMQQEAKSTGQSKKLPTNLDKLLNDIQEVINDMKSNKYDDKLVQKQEKILSRMLDATKSINDRDYEEKREAELSQQRFKGSFNKLKLEDNNNFNGNSIDNLIKEGYSEDYLKLIQNYFKLINK